MSPATEAQVKAVREAVLEAYGFALPDHAIRAMIETGLSHSASVVRTTASPLTVFDLTKPITATHAIERRNEAKFAKRRLLKRLVSMAIEMSDGKEYEYDGSERWSFSHQSIEVAVETVAHDLLQAMLDYHPTSGWVGTPESLITAFAREHGIEL